MKTKQDQILINHRLGIETLRRDRDDLLVELDLLIAWVVYIKAENDPNSYLLKRAREVIAKVKSREVLTELEAIEISKDVTIGYMTQRIDALLTQRDALVDALEGMVHAAKFSSDWPSVRNSVALSAARAALKSMMP